MVNITVIAWYNFLDMNFVALFGAVLSYIYIDYAFGSIHVLIVCIEPCFPLEWYDHFFICDA